MKIYTLGFEALTCPKTLRYNNPYPEEKPVLGVSLTLDEARTAGEKYFEVNMSAFFSQVVCRQMEDDQTIWWVSIEGDPMDECREGTHHATLWIQEFEVPIPSA